MAYCVSYTKKTGEYFHELYQSRRSSPYDDWRQNRRRRPSVVAFQFAKHWIESDLFVYFQPKERLVSMYLELEYYYFELKATLIIDDVGRTIGIDRLSCKNDNIWPELNGGPKSSLDCGGIALYKKNLRYLLPPYDVSMEMAAKLFFGDDWTALPLPLTRPRLDMNVSTSREMRTFFDDHPTGPWRQTIGKFVPDEDASAIVIQKCFRGWRARMVYAFNPHTTLGRYYALRLFFGGATPKSPGLGCAPDPLACA